jgi:hypothetical protein
MVPFSLRRVNRRSNCPATSFTASPLCVLVASRLPWLLAVVLSWSAVETRSAPQSKPKVLMFSAIDVDYLNDKLARRGNVLGVNGFMLAYIGEWWSREADLSKNAERLKRLTKLGTTCGIDSNFIKVALGYREIPQWDDEEAWAQVAKNFGAIAALARRTGLKGLAIDTENYDTKVWLAEPLRFKRASKDTWHAFVRKRGTQVMQAIISAYPGAETILLQEGAYWWYQRRERSYELWLEFYNGLASARPTGGLVVATESTYSQTSATDIRAKAREIRDSMSQHVQDRNYWNEYGSVAIGVWPLGKSYDDKSARYSVADFMQQFNAAAELSKRYVWIYGHGAAWWQVTEDEIKRYADESHWIWGPKYQAAPTIPALDQYRQVFAPSTVPVCSISK